jgi:hypothetical protein
MQQVLIQQVLLQRTLTQQTVMHWILMQQIQMQLVLLQRVLLGVASQGKKAAVEQRDAGLKPQGQAARKEDSASLPSPSFSPFPLLVSGLGDKPATPQELASAGVCARNLPPLDICVVGRGRSSLAFSPHRACLIIILSSAFLHWSPSGSELGQAIASRKKLSDRGQLAHGSGVTD